MPTNLPKSRDQTKARQRERYFRAAFGLLKVGLAFTCAMIIWSLWWYAWE